MVSTSSTQRLSDHLGSTSLTTDSAGNVISELRYTAWGEVRYQAGTTSTGYQFAGQFSYAADFGLLYYNARWYDPALGRFAQADSIVPGGVQGFDRYAYVNNSPVNYVDPSGHKACWDTAKYSCDLTDKDVNNLRYGTEDEQKFINNLIPMSGSTNKEGECDEYGCWVFVGTYTQDQLSQIADDFRGLARSDRVLAWLLPFAFARYFGKPGVIPGGVFGFGVNEMSPARERIASFFDAAADDAAKPEYEGKFVIGLYKLNENYKNYEPGYYLTRPYAEYQRVEGWQYKDVIWILNDYGKNYYGK